MTAALPDDALREVIREVLRDLVREEVALALAGGLAGGLAGSRAATTRPTGSVTTRPTGGSAPAVGNRLESGVVTERFLGQVARAGHTTLTVGSRVVITPLARDRARSLGVVITKDS